MTHQWENEPEASTDTDVFWHCSVCFIRIGFNRKGIGVPFASETELPSNADDYVPPCLSPGDADVALLSRAVVAGLDLDGLVSAGKISDVDAKKLRAKVDSVARATAQAKARADIG